MGDKKKIVGYFTDDRSIYCVECIKRIEKSWKKLKERLPQTRLKKENFFAMDVKGNQIGTDPEVQSGKYRVKVVDREMKKKGLTK